MLCVSFFELLYSMMHTQYYTVFFVYRGRRAMWPGSRGTSPLPSSTTAGRTKSLYEYFAIVFFWNNFFLLFYDILIINIIKRAIQKCYNLIQCHSWSPCHHSRQLGAAKNYSWRGVGNWKKIINCRVLAATKVCREFLTFPTQPSPPSPDSWFPILDYRLPFPD